MKVYNSGLHSSLWAPKCVRRPQSTILRQGVPTAQEVELRQPLRTRPVWLSPSTAGIDLANLTGSDWLTGQDQPGPQ